jgi:hypothetical protein
LVLLGVVVPVVAVGPDRYAELTGSWLDNMILPGLVKGAWYPIHVNQSLSGIVSRYFLGEPYGDIHWGPDDLPFELVERHEYITLIEVSPETARWILRAGQLVILGVSAWAIGWRRLPRDDGRRGLHYALVVLGMMLLNQRTWDHHATVILVAAAAVWYALAYGRLSPRVRILSLVLVILGGCSQWLTGEGMLFAVAWLGGTRGEALEPRAERWANLAKAYGQSFYYFVLVWIATVVLLRRLRRREQPFAECRQRLTESPDRGRVGQPE